MITFVNGNRRLNSKREHKKENNACILEKVMLQFFTVINIYNDKGERL